MPHFGRNHFPRRFGGGERIVESEHRAILAELETYGYDISEDSHIYVDTYAEARLSEAIWAVNGRVQNQGLPLRMQEFVPIYEAACRLRPAPTDSITARRKAIAAKLRGLSGNTTTDVSDAVEAIAGTAFVSVLPYAESDEWAYWPAGTPGPPGMEWSSNRATYVVRLTDAMLTQDEYIEIASRCAIMLDDLLRVDMTYVIGIDEGGFKADIGRADITLV